MTKKISVGVTVILIAAAIIISSVTTLFVVFSSYNNLLVDLPQRADQYLKLAEIDELIRSNYYGSIDTESIDDALASGFINGLKDDHSYYISSDDIASFNNFLNGKSDGIGINAYYDFSGPYLTVSYVYAGSPAEASAIDVSCIITSVNGKNVSDENYEELIDEICNTTGKKIKITYADSPESADIKTAELVSGYEMQSCHFLVNDNVGYIRLSAFYESTYSAFIDAMKNMVDNKISSVIIDLRNSSGYNFTEAAKIIDYIVPVGTEGTGAIFTAKNLGGETVSQFVSDSVASNLSFAVLINSRTEGAAELVACDLKDFGKAILIGENTSGHGTMQQLFELQDGGYAFVTVAEIYPYISSSFNNTGIAPDVEILTSESFKNKLGTDNFDNDEQYSAAVKYLTGK